MGRTKIASLRRIESRHRDDPVARSRIRNDGIAVNAIAPGLTLVEATEHVPEDRHRQYIDGRR